MQDRIRRWTAEWLTRRRFAYLGSAAVLVIVALANRRAGEPEPPEPGPPAAEMTGRAPATADPDSGQGVEPAAAPEPAATDTPGVGGPSPWAAPQRAIVPPTGRVPRPAAVRGLYLNAWAAGSSRKLERLIGIARATEINTFVIDVKEGGRISYPSRVPLAREIGADARYIRDIEGVIAKLREAGIYPIARIVVFRDPVLARARPDLAVRHRDGGDWVDRDDHAWVDSYNRDVWDYNIAIAREAIELGFSEVQWDYVRFPDVPRSLMEAAVFPAAAGRSKADAIREFLSYSREQLADLGVPVTADVFGLTVSARGDMGIGQQWEKMLDATDVLLPMVYPSHFARGSYGIVYPNSEPYRTVKTALEHARRRTDGVPQAATIRPWLQDFTLGQPAYGAAHVRAQIRAVRDAGFDEWLLWNPSSNYTVEALANPDGTEPDLPIPDFAWVEPDSARAHTLVADTTRADTTRADTMRADTTRADTTGARTGPAADTAIVRRRSR